MNILFICTGNTCRSPMAEAAAKKIIGENAEKYRFIKVASAGLAAYSGDAASFYACEAAALHGAALEDFRSTKINGYLVDAADLVLTMTRGQKTELSMLWPESQKKTYTLGEYADNDIDVGDPYGSDLESYLKCYELIESQIRTIFTKLSNTNGGNQDENCNRQ